MPDEFDIIEQRVQAKLKKREEESEAAVFDKIDARVKAKQAEKDKPTTIAPPPKRTKPVSSYVEPGGMYSGIFGPEDTFQSNVAKATKRNDALTSGAPAPKKGLPPTPTAVESIVNAFKPKPITITTTETRPATGKAPPKVEVKVDPISQIVGGGAGGPIVQREGPRFTGLNKAGQNPYQAYVPPGDEPITSVPAQYQGAPVPANGALGAVANTFSRPTSPDLLNTARAYKDPATGETRYEPDPALKMVLQASGEQKFPMTAGSQAAMQGSEGKGFWGGLLDVITNPLASAEIGLRSIGSAGLVPSALTAMPNPLARTLGAYLGSQPVEEAARLGELMRGRYPGLDITNYQAVEDAIASDPEFWQTALKQAKSASEVVAVSEGLSAAVAGPAAKVGTKNPLAKRLVGAVAERLTDMFIAGAGEGTAQVTSGMVGGKSFGQALGDVRGSDIAWEAGSEFVAGAPQLAGALMQRGPTPAAPVAQPPLTSPSNQQMPVLPPLDVVGEQPATTFETVQAPLPRETPVRGIAPPEAVTGRVEAPVLMNPPRVRAEVVAPARPAGPAPVAKSATPAPGEVKAWEMNRDELAAAYDEARAYEDNADVQALGEKGAQEWRRLQRQLNSTDSTVTGKAQERISEIEAILTPDQERLLYGIGETRPSAEFLKDALDAVEYVETADSSAELSRRVGRALVQLGGKTDVAKMDGGQKRAYTQLAAAARVAQERGYDANKVIEDAFKSAGKEIGDPQDIELMLGDLWKARTPAKPAKPAAGEGEIAPAKSAGKGKGGEVAVVRPKGWEAQNEVPATWTRKGHVYRGLTAAEYDATIGAGKGVQSRRDYSLAGEGTSFSDKADDAEAYVNFGRDDPRKTGKPNYLIEVSISDDLVKDTDGYYKAQKEIAPDRVTRVIRMSAVNGEIVAEDVVQVKPKVKPSPAPVAPAKSAEATPAPEPKPSGIESRLSEEGKAALERLRAQKLTRGAVGNLPKGEGASEQLTQRLKDVAVIGRDLVKAGVNDFDTWAREMKDIFTDWVEEHLPKIWAEVNPQAATDVKPPSTEPTGLSYATVEAKTGTPSPRPERRGWEVDITEGKQKLTDNPRAGEELVTKLLNDPRPYDQGEVALLTLHKARVENDARRASDDLAAARAAGDDAGIADAYSRTIKHEGELAALQEATLNGGASTLTARELSALRMLVNPDWSLAKLKQQYRDAKKGEALTPEEVKAAERVETRLKELDAREEALNVREAELASKEAHAALVRKQGQNKRRPPAVSPGTSLRTRLKSTLSTEEHARFEADVERMLSRVSGLSENIDVAAVADIAKVVGWYLKMGGRYTAASMRATLRKEFPALKKVKDEILDAAFKQGMAENTPSREPIIERLKINVEEKSTPGIIRSVLLQLEQFHYQNGVKDREARIDAVYADVKDILPGITRNETMVALAGHGIWTPLTKDVMAIAIRQGHAEMLQLSKLEDMQKGRPPKRTGQERPAQTVEERRLVKQVNEAKKKGGYQVTDPAKQLATALQSRKTYYRNRMVDLKEEIATRKRFIKNSTAPPSDAELKRLQAEYEKVKAEHDAIFVKPGMTEAQRLKLATDAATRALADAQKQLADAKKGIFKRAGKRLTTPQLNALRARAEAIRAEIKALEIMADPAKEQQRIDALYKASLSRQIADYQQRISDGDFEMRTRKPRALSQEMLNLQFEREQVKEKWMEGVLKQQIANRDAAMKALEMAREVSALRRSIITAFDFSAVLRQGAKVAYSHPILAARAIMPMLRAFRSERGQFAADQRIKNDPLYQLSRQAKLDLTEFGTTADIAKMEEAYRSRWAEKIPIVAGSGRAYVTFLNKARFDLFKVMVRTLGHSTEVSVDQAKVIAKFVNIATGRGDLGSMETAGQLLNETFFAAKYNVSGIQYLTAPLTGMQMYTTRSSATGKYIPISPRLRAMIVGEYARTILGYAVVMGLAAAAGGEIDKDLRSSAGWRIRFGKVVLDPWAGLAQWATLGARVLTGTTKTAKGDIVPTRGEDVPYGRDDSADLMLRFARQKFAPNLATTFDLLAGRNVIGEPVTLQTEFLPSWQYPFVPRFIAPFSQEEIVEAFKDQGVGRGTAIAILSTVGWGLNVYDPGGKPKRRN